MTSILVVASRTELVGAAERFIPPEDIPLGPANQDA